MDEAVACAFLCRLFEKCYRMRRVMKAFEIAWGLEREMKKLEQMLSVMTAVFEVAEKKQLKSKALRNCLTSLEDVAYDADDIIDEFVTKALQWKAKANHPIKKFVRNSFSLSILFRLKMRDKMKEMAEIYSISVERSRFYLIDGEGEGGIHRRLHETQQQKKYQQYDDSHAMESIIYGREDDKEKIVDLMLTTHARDELDVIPIVGMGGLGKTTVAQLVFNDDRVLSHFEPRIWVCVSEYFKLDNLMKEILESATGHASHHLTEIATLQNRLQDALHGKRFLLVLDDVWNERHAIWDILRSTLRCGGRGSKVIVTTRIENSARIMGTLPSHRLSYLSEDDCWSLFKQQAFGFEGEENKKLALIGKDIVNKCGGVPLAARSLGGLLRFKREESEWLFVRDNGIWNLPEEEDGIIPSLRRSYNHLPPHLKQCFAFCCLFPKGSEIDNESLIHLWVANGFIVPYDIWEPEDIANKYFNELLRLSLFQDVQKDNDGNIMKCRMHDLIHDLARSVAGDDYAIMDSCKVHNVAIRYRHISLATRSTFLERLGESHTLHTVLLLDYHVDDSNVFDSLSRFHGLRVLDLSNMSIRILPPSIKNMIHLRYLDLSNTDIEILPDSTCSLKNLLTLKLRNCQNFCNLPKGLRNMYSLRHLDIYNTSLTKMPKRIGKLSCLQTLSFYIVGNTSGRRIGELNDFNLRGELRLNDLQLVRNIADAKAANLISKKNLCVLILSWRQYGGSYTIQQKEEEVLEGLQPHSNLKQLDINGYGGINFPTWIQDSKLSYLVKISLSSCRSCKGLPSLGLLPALKHLSIRHMDVVKCIGSDFYGDDNTVKGFPSLKELHLADMPNLEKWLGADGKATFPCLWKLVINKCPMLTSLPCFPSLQHLELLECSSAILMPVANLTSVSFLLLHEISGLESLPEGMLRYFNFLNSLFIVHCKELMTLSRALDNLSALKTLFLLGCNTLVSLPDGLGKLISLEKLGITRCHGLILLPEEVVGGLTSLQYLYVRSCYNLTSLPDNLQYLSALQTIDIKRCPKLALPSYLHHLNEDDLRIKDPAIVDSSPLGSMTKAFSVDEELKEMDEELKEICQLTGVSNINTMLLEIGT